MTTAVIGPASFPSSGTVTTANLEEWLLHVRTSLINVGLVQTSDTGQLTSGALPAFAATWGYVVFRFDDPAQATDPIFIKITLGKLTASYTCQGYTVQIGQGTNGAGTLTGNLTGAFATSRSNVIGGTTQTIYSCFKDGTLFWGAGYGNDASSMVFQIAFSVERTRNPAGALDGAGISLIYKLNPAAWRAQSVRYLSPAGAYVGGHNSFCLVPTLPADTANSAGDKQLYPHFYNMPEVRQRWSSFTVRLSEFSTAPTAFVATAMYATPRTYVSMGSGAPGSGGYMTANATDNASFGPCFIWE